MCLAGTDLFPDGLQTWNAMLSYVVTAQTNLATKENRTRFENGVERCERGQL